MIIVTPSAVFEKLRFQLKRKAGVFKIPGLKSIFEEFCFRGGLVWTVGLAAEIKLRFQSVDGALSERGGKSF